MRPAFPFGELRAAWRGLAAGVAIAAAAGCFTAPPPERYAPALTPRGRDVQVVVTRAATAAAGDRRFDAELLAVSDSALLVQRRGARVLLVKWGAIESAHVRSAWATLYAAPTPDQARRWRLLSRYPQGLPAPMLERLLTERGQPSVVVVGQ